MTFRDFAQGCWRMRGLGKGQKAHILVTKGVEKLIKESKQTHESHTPLSRSD